MAGEIITSPALFHERAHVPIGLSRIFEVVGLPETYLTDEKFLKNYVVPSIATICSSGELYTQHTPIHDPKLRELFGYQQYSEGTFGQRVETLFENHNQLLHQEAKNLIEYAANVCAHDVVAGNLTVRMSNFLIHTKPGLTPKERRQEEWLGYLSTTGIRDLMDESMRLRRPQRDLTKPKLEFADYLTIPLDRTPERVVDYTPSVQSIYHIERQLADLLEAQPTYSYIAIGKGPFINEFLRGYWSAKLNDNQYLMSHKVSKYFVGYDGGIAAVTQQLASQPEFADLVLATDIYKANYSYSEMREGIINAYRMLHPQGTLVLSVPHTIPVVQRGHTFADTLSLMALEAGFDPDQAEAFYTVAQDSAGKQRTYITTVFRK